MKSKLPYTAYQRIFQAILLVTISLVAVSLGAAIAKAEELEPAKITLHPAAEPTPALKYRLLPKFIDRKPGNAAVFYGKVNAEQSRYFGSSGQEIRDKVDRWGETPLQDLLKEEARVSFNTHFLRQGALCAVCDWQLLIREGKYFELLLPEVQQTREFTRILSAKARIHIAHSEFEQAIETLQTGLAFGRNVAAGETLVNGLVGIAISREMLKQAIEFVQQPDAPNLYWALTMLPRPFVDLRDGLEAEMSAFALSYPELRDLETKHRSQEEWQKVLYSFSEYYALFSDQNHELGHVAIYLKMMKNYPAAKALLIKQGRREKQVEAMSKEQVVALSAFRNVKRWQQEVGKYYHLPYPATVKGMTSVIKQAKKEPSEFAQALERLMRTRKVIASNTRRFEVLRILEALRIHAAAHDGKLPTHLSDITAVPIPLDPVTGKPFAYQLQGKTAVLRGPAILDIPLNYEITMKPQPN